MTEAKRHGGGTGAPAAGTVTFIFDVTGAPRFTLVIPGDWLVDLLDAIAPAVEGIAYHTAVASFRDQFRQLRACGTDDDLRVFAMAGARLALYHPAAGPLVRRSVSIGMRRGERVHVTVAVGAKGLAVGVATHVLELAALAASLPMLATILQFDEEPHPSHVN